jgi:hypothetical protein
VLFHLNFITKYLSLNAHFHKLYSIAQQPFEDFFANDLDECSLLRGVLHLKTGGVLPLPTLHNFLTMC